jgi:hypothetical protein
MSGQPAFSYSIKKAGNRPQEVTVLMEGESPRQFLFGPHVTEKYIALQLPRLIMDSKFKRKVSSNGLRRQARNDQKAAG